ncbi:MAG TPA: penicillin-binding protein 2 [Candidatus Omnitrophota bacterium]|nr:penicillin-binding protein 2 [Candidatus Omnitrophota bacterium]HPT06861.1 penicillin-binding protein 2 [Candidatus Omnitrophota bacterium]
MRQRIISLVLGACLIVLFAGVFNLQIIHGKAFKVLSDKNSIRLAPQIGARGTFVDRFGLVIVDNALSYDVLVVPQKREKLAVVLEKVSTVLGISEENVVSKYRARFQVSSLPVLIAKDVSVRKAMALEEMNFDLGQKIVVQPYPLRNYPYGSLAAHVVGYLNKIDYWRLNKLEDYGYQTKDIVGYTGLEERYDYYVRQKEGGLSMEVDHHGRFVRVLGYEPPKNGRQLQLTIDLKIQRIVETILHDRRGCVILMNPFTGEIVAMASYPTFDPATFIRKGDSSAVTSLFTDPNSPLLNRAISSSYPPASVFKLVVAAAGIEQGKITPETAYDCSGSMMVGNKRFGCWAVHGHENLIQALTHSCDIFFYRTGLLLRAQTIHDYAIRFGFGRTTGIDIPNETGGFVPDPAWKKRVRKQIWYDGDTANFSIGQGDLLVTPLQITRLVSVFANRGYLVSPHLLKAVDGKDVSGMFKKPVRVAIKQSTIEYIREGLQSVVSVDDGTGNVLKGLPVSIGGKTGTAQVPHGLSHGWFAGFFPFNNPRYAMCVFLENGGGGHAAAQLTREIVQEMIRQNAL